MSNGSTSRKSARVNRAKLREQVLSAVSGDIEPVKVTTSYKFALAGVALFMVVLPLIYLGIVSMTVFLVYFHATHNVSFVGSGRGGFFGYLVPLVIGATLILFMVKPFFTRRPYQQKPRRLKRDAQPLLFEYVEQICHAVGAPVPKSIRVDCEPNASASFRNGVWSMLGSSDLALTIGLPFVEGLTLRQLSGVLAHEFGHFSQGTGMRVSYLIRKVNYWLMRTAYERDAVDEWLYKASRSIDLRIGIFFYAARLFVWIVRQVVKGLAWAGNFASCYMLREMEYDADRYETRLAGSKTFEKTSRRIVELSLAHGMAIRDLQQFWEEGRLADNLPRLVNANIRFFTPEIRKDLHKRSYEQKTGMFDTHPADRDRIASSRQEDAPGVFHLSGKRDDLPASVLFDDYARVCSAVTNQFYEEVLGPSFDKSQVHPVDQLLERQNAEIEAGKALQRYFQVQIPPLRPLPVADDAGQRPESPSAAGERLKTARARMLEELDDYERFVKRYQNAEGVLFGAISACVLTDVGFRIDPSDFELKKGTHRAATAKRDRCRDALRTLAGKMLAFETEAGSRLSAALQLLRLNRVCSKIEGGEALRDEVETLLPEAQFVSGLMAELPPFRFLYHETLTLLSRLEGNEDNRKLISAIRDRMEKIHHRACAVEEQLGDQLYPFDHARADMTLREFALPVVPDEDDLSGLMGAAETLFEKLVTVQMRLFARLAHAAEKVETALGLPPLPDPEEKKKREKEERERAERERRRRTSQRSREAAAARTRSAPSG